MKYCTILFVLIVFTNRLCGQSLLNQADKEFNALSYLKASAMYENLLDSKSLSEGEKLSAMAKLGFSYKQLKDSENAERVFRDLISGYGKDLPADYVICYLYYAQALAGNGKYQEAQETYEKYYTLHEEDKRGPSFSKLYSNVALLTKNIDSYKVDYLSINSSATEFSPTLYKDGLIFVSNRLEAVNIKRVFNWDETAFLDLYFVPNLNKMKGKSDGPSSLGGSYASASNPKQPQKKRLLGLEAYTPYTANDSRKVGFFTGSSYNSSLGYDERPLTESEKISKTLNTKYHEGPATFYKDGNRVIFTRNNYNKGKYRTSEEGINKLKLYTAELVNGKWTHVEELPFNSDEFSSGHPALNPDNTLLYFASDRPGGFGGTDIYVTRQEGSSWSEPVNMGPTVNTSGNEMFPFIDANGNLYFSSDGHPGMGELDLFFTPMKAFNDPIKVINLGAPINSSKDDFGIVTDGERSLGYFSSNRKNGGKDDDIYRFRREGPLYACRDLTILVYDEVTNRPIKNALIQMENKTVSTESQRQLRTDSTGNLLLCLAAENDFTLVASGEGYRNNTVGFSTSAYGDEHPTLLEIPLSKAGYSPQEVVSDVTAKGNSTGKVLSQKDSKPLAGVRIKIKDDTNGEVQEAVSDPDGKYTFRSIPGHNYTFDAVLDNYGTFGKQIVGLDPEDSTSMSIRMFGKGDLVRIDNIYYDLNKYRIRSDAAYELNKVVDLLNKYPSMKIELGSHTDSRASTKYNRTLSNNRAKAAKDYLVSKGISASRLTTKGYGESQLINNCKDEIDCTEEQHQENRRTEIRITKLQ